MAESSVLIRLIQDVNGDTHAINATQLDGKTLAQIEELISAGVQIEVVSTLPTASASTMGKIYMVPDASAPAGSNIKKEYVTYNAGTQAAPSYKWEQIGTTETDLSSYVKKGTYTTSSADETKTSSSNGGETVTGTAQVSYLKPNANTGNSGAIEADLGSLLSFNGTAATISVSAPKDTYVTNVTASDFTPAGTITGSQTVGSHTHSIGSSTVSVATITGWSAGSHGTDTFTDGSYYKQQFKVTGSASDGVLSIADAATATKTGATFSSGAFTAPSLTYTGATVVASVNAATGGAGAVTISGSNFGFSGTAGAVSLTVTKNAAATLNGSYTPAGSITGTLTVAAHSHSVGTTSATASGTATVTTTSHTHSVTITHTHTVDLKSDPVFESGNSSK